MRDGARADGLDSWEEIVASTRHRYPVAYRAEPSRMWIADERRPLCADDEVVVVMMAAGLCATDVRVYTGARPVPDGRIGHEGIGVLSEVGAVAMQRGYRTGMTVVFDCNHPDPRFRDLHLDGVLGRAYKVPAAFVTSAPQQRLIPIDALLDAGAMSIAEGALLEPLTVALHAVDYVRRRTTVPREAYDDLLVRHRRGALGDPGHVAGKDVMVIGAGTIGTFCAAFARLNGAKSVTLVNRGRAGLEHAARVLPVDRALVEDALGPDASADVVLVASHEDAVARAMRSVRDGGVVVLVAGIAKTATLETDEGTVELYPIRHDDLTRTIRIHGKAIVLMGAHGTNEVLFREVARCFETGEFAARGVVPSAQITHVVSLGALPHVFREVATRHALSGARVGKVIVDFRLSGDQVHVVDDYRRLYGERADELLRPSRSAAMRDAIRAELDRPPRDTGAAASPSERAAFEHLVVTIERALRHESGRMVEVHLDANERAYLERALDAARAIYADMDPERRSLPDGRPFVFHALDVATYATAHLGTSELARRAAGRDVRGLVELAAGLLLHDALEHNPRVSADWLAEHFGDVPRDIAEDLSQHRSVAAGILDVDAANVAIKTEHYRRLTSSPRHPLGPALKLADNVVNYEMHLSSRAARVKRRSAEELALLRDFLNDAPSRFHVPSAFRTDMDACLRRYEGLPPC